MDFKALINKALTIRKKYEELEIQNYGRSWTGEELTLGFVKDVGDLAMLVQAKEGVRKVDDLDNALAHELSDCLWSVIALANKYDVDLEAAFIKTMDELDGRMHTQF
ncbi:nucleotide pyrophosphohydrolase [Candidatus Kaiserbacteria bacterium]|jgi:NTP pyrophosphatase (non-canonical NTP hydrolase)|nr:nucleotide pyrophosphohydrolase [Candidatus Kaiserbacteria bacterium]